MTVFVHSVVAPRGKYRVFEATGPFPSVPNVTDHDSYEIAKTVAGAMADARVFNDIGRCILDKSPGRPILDATSPACP